MADKTYQLIRRLSETPAPSGYELRMAEMVTRVWDPYVDQIRGDRVGNIVAVKEGAGKQPRHRILLAAHMDEIGLIIKNIEKYPNEPGGYGFLRFTNVGGVDVRQLYDQAVIIHGSSGQDIPAIVGSLPARMLPDEIQNKSFGYDELVIDPGLTYEVLVEQVSVGDFVSFRQTVRKLLNRRVSGKALDNRAAIAATTLCLELLSDRRHEWDVLAVATAQEETRLLGAFTSAFSLQPDLAVVIDVTFGKGPGVKDDDAFELNEGPVLGFGSNVHPSVYRKLSDTAADIEMKVHIDPHQALSGTDAEGIQIAREGVPTGLIEIPLRYMHTNVECLALADLERTGRLLAEFVCRLDNETIPDLISEMVD